MRACRCPTLGVSAGARTSNGQVFARRLFPRLVQKPCLRALFEEQAVKSDKDLKFGQNFMRRCFPKLSQAQKDELLEWEAKLCCRCDEAVRLFSEPAKH